MAIHSYGFAPNSSSGTEKDFAVFHVNLPILLEHSEHVRSNEEWRSIEMSFAWCSWPYVTGDGPLPLGLLLEGYSNGLFIEPCPDCVDNCFVTIFSGSPLSGSNSWSGICLTCNEQKKGKDSIHKPFTKRLLFVSDIRKTLEKTERTLDDLLAVIYRQ